MNNFWKKKLPALLLALVLIAGLMPTAMAEETTPSPSCSHQWAWRHDGTNRHARVCGICNGVDSQGECSPGEWQKKDNAKHEKICSVCGLQVAEESHSLRLIEDASTKPTCYQAGKNVKVCVCGYTVTETVPATGQHTWSTTWSSNATHHWHPCMTPGCTVTTNAYAAHSPSSGVYASDSSSHWLICKDCNATYNKAAHADNNRDGACDVCKYSPGTLPSGSISVIFRNGSSNYNVQSGIVSGGKPSNPGTPTYPNPVSNCAYSFKGWTTVDPGTKAIYTGQSLTSPTAQAVTANTIYYAVYTASASSRDAALAVGTTATTVGSGIRTEVNNQFYAVTGQSFSSVTFSGASSSSYGVLYANSGKTNLGSREYAYTGGSYPVTDLYFAPGQGAYTIQYTAKDNNGSTVAGQLTLSANGSVSVTGDVVVRVAPGSTVNLKVSQFEEAYRKLSGTTSVPRYVEFNPGKDYDDFAGQLYAGSREMTRSRLDGVDFYIDSQSDGDYALKSVNFKADRDAKDGRELSIPFEIFYRSSVSYRGTLRIIIDKDGQDGDVVYYVAPGASVNFNRDDFNRAYQDLAGTSKTITRVEFTPGDDYTSFSGKIRVLGHSDFTKKELASEWFYYENDRRNSYSIDDLVFQASSGAKDGDCLEIPFYACRDNDDEQEGVLRIVVDKNGSRDTVTLNVAPGASAKLDKTAFNKVYQTLYGSTKRTISAVSFQAPDSYRSFDGALYAGRDELLLKDLAHDETWFYYSSSSAGKNDYLLENVTFQADRDAREGANISIPFYAYYDNDRNEYEMGVLRIVITSEANTLTYEAAPGGMVNLSAEDFNRAYQTMSGTSRTIKYVAFEADSDYVNFAGALYTGNTQLTRSNLAYNQTLFYYNNTSFGTYALSSLSFRPTASAKDGSSLTIPFRAYYDGSAYEQGTLKLVVGTGGDITCTVTPGKTVNLDRTKFDDFFRKSYSSSSLEYIVFDVPGSADFPDSCGTLYTGYNTSYSVPFSRSSLEDVRFYYNASDAGHRDYALNDVTFAAANSFTSGKVTLRFTAYGVNDREVEGTLVILPATAAAAVSNLVGSVRYAVTSGTNVQINANDLARFFKTSYPTGALQYVTLNDVPAAGALYYNYYGASKYGAAAREQITAANRNRNFYMSPASASEYALTELTYVPSGSNYCASIPFTAYGAGGQSVTGAILISVTTKAVSEVYGPTPKNTTVTFPASSIVAAVSAATGAVPSGIQLLKLPAANVGVIYEGAGTTPATTTTVYTYNTGAQQLGQLRFVPQTGYTGPVEIPYAALNANGVPYATGMFSMGVLNTNKKFSDITAATWCYKYVTELADASVIDGYSNGSFRPDNTITYGAALKLIMLAAGYSEQAPTAGGSTFSGYLAKAQADGLITRTNVNLGGPITRLQVAQLAAGALKLDINNLSSVKPFTDTADVYVQALNAAGIVEGYFNNGTSTFRPSNTLTRGQVSAIVWRMQNYRK